MFDPGGDATALTCAVALVCDGVDELLDAELCRAADGELLDAVRKLEVQRRRLAAVDAALVAELDQRTVAGAHGCRDTASLLSQSLRIDAGEAKARVCAARELGPRRALTGEALAPVYGIVAAAVGVGAISSTQARIVTSTIIGLPHAVQAEKDLEIEAFLTEQARLFGPRELRIIARRLRDTYDQDGRLAEDRDREQRRELTVRQHADGCVSGRFFLDPIAGEALRTVLDATAQPVPGPDGERDPRRPAQRNHDAIRDVLLKTLRTGELPATGGITTTIILIMNERQVSGQIEPGDGLVPTGHDALISIENARTLLGDAQVFPVRLGKLKRIDAYSDTHRIFTEGQRLAMIARDGGCSFPTCTAPPAWCEAHHVLDYALGGPTSVENGTLLCPYHHRTFEQNGWTCSIVEGAVYWTPPTWIDADQRPRRNHTHAPDPTPEGFP